jgi:hypothetical protein
MIELHGAVRRAGIDLLVLRKYLDDGDSSVKERVRSNLDLQLVSVQVLERELRAGAINRRTWSLGQAAVPVLFALLKQISKQYGGPAAETVDRCQQSLAALSAELVRFAQDQ